jgi:hypothetical protein
MNRAARVSARSSVISKLQRFQRLADGLEWILSPLRLPVRHPGVGKPLSLYGSSCEF